MCVEIGVILKYSRCGIKHDIAECYAGILIACIARKDEILFPTGDDAIQSGDTVIVISTGGKIKSIKDILE